MADVNPLQVSYGSLNEWAHQTKTHFFHISGFRNIPWTYSSVKTLWKLSELCQGVAEQHVRMGAVEQNTDYSLRRTGIVDDLERHNTHSTTTDVRVLKARRSETDQASAKPSETLK